ncbi:site-specific integrase [Lachnospiraceae bacterium OttesenSCG-928-D06]|nr:site-specific integrase [Lachnospiraceae bacterium OttesenSCG-928-D06]
MKTTMAIKTCQLILEQMEQDRYSESTIYFYGSVYKEFNKYLIHKGYNQYTDDVRDDFLLDIYGIRIYDFNHLPKHRQKCIRAVELIAVYAATAKIPVLLSYDSNTEKELPDAYRNAFEGYVDWLGSEGLAPATVTQRQSRNSIFLEFLVSKGIRELNEMEPGILYDFVHRLEGYSNRTINLYILILNDFLRYLYLQGLMLQDLSKVISTVMKRDERLPSIWKKEEIQSYLSVIDRATPIGKRDYAVSLLAIRLGLRGCDIRELKLKDFDWKNNSINICQKKTKEPLSLPLLEEIGWAVIDYIKNARPKTEYKNLFVRMTPPFTPYNSYNFQTLIDKYCHAAGIDCENRKQGLHCFRHSLATQLMNDQVPVQMIRSVLGHKNVQSVKEYLKVNIDQLRECSLSPEVTYG